MSTPSFSDDRSATFFVRWRGKQEGPYTAAAIEAKMAANQIGLLHEIYHSGQWVTLRDYLAQRESAHRAAQEARAARERSEREEMERKKNEIGVRIVQKPGGPTSAMGVTSPPPGFFNSRATRIIFQTLIIVACAGVGIWVFIQLFAKGAARDTNISQPSSSSIRQATKTAWRAMQQADLEAATTNVTSASKYYELITLRYSQIVADDADPEIKEFIRDRVKSSKELAAIWGQVEVDLEKSQAGRTDIAKLLEVLTTGLAATAKNDRSTGDNMQAGQMAGKLSGKLADFFMSKISDGAVQDKYGKQLQAASTEYDRLSGLRPPLGERLGKKYDLQLLDTF